MRSGALALAGALILSAASMAAAESTQPAGGSPSGPELTSLERIQVGAVRRGRLVTLRRLYPAIERAHFPVVGGHRYGESGARFGTARSGHVHEGQDVFARAGTPLVAVTDGVVLEAGDGGGRGNYVAIYDGYTRRTYVYLHLLHPARVKAGERVAGGRRIGAVGCTGSCWGDHLHFEIRIGRGANGKAVDPLPHLRSWARH
jgi:murein DD-endopeptidase MepM/ murein hydrolase activator NlpD